jgi:hypothetical protein
MPAPSHGANARVAVEGDVKKLQTHQVLIRVNTGRKISPAGWRKQYIATTRPCLTTATSLNQDTYGYTGDDTLRHEGS